MTLPTSVTSPPDALASDLDVSRLWDHAFPSPDLVRASAGLLTPLRAWDGSEGQRARLVIGPGCVQVARVDPAKAERAEQRRRAASWTAATLDATDLLLEHRRDAAVETLTAVNALAAGGVVEWPAVESAGALVEHFDSRITRRDQPDPEPAARIVAWSRKSRARMVRVLAEVDYGPLFADGCLPAMLTLTYPGDWLAVAPSAAACKRHMDALAKRFRRQYGRPLLAVWKREFQRRGAPHYHLLMVPPREVVNGETFAAWVSRTWAEVVNHPDPDQRRLHAAAGTGLDYAEGMRARDPKRLAVYFSKHGAYGAKEYQNVAPVEWVEAGGSVGRFWGLWGLERATATVEVTPVEALAAVRTMRRWQEANGYRVQREVRRRRWNTTTGEVRHHSRCPREGCEGYCWRRKSGAWSGARLRGSAGFVVVNDGAAFASRLAVLLDQVRERAQVAEVESWLTDPSRLAALDSDPSVVEQHARRVCWRCLSPISADLTGHVGECSGD